MKKFFIAIIAMLSVITMQAQEAGKVRIGLSAGMNLSTMNLKAAHSSRIGFNAGLMVDYSFMESMFVNLGLRYSQKGVKWNKSQDVSADLVGNPGYIELPIHFGYRYKFSDNGSVFIETGPYFAYGITGKLSAKGYTSENYFGDNSLKPERFDCGWGAVVGAEYAKFQLRIGYDWGFKKAFDIVNSAKIRNFHVGLAYMF